MKVYRHGLLVTDLARDPLDFRRPGPEEVRSALRGMILSASGWRGVFAVDGNEESRTAEIADVHRFLIFAAGLAFCSWLKERRGRSPTILIAVDTRPTGPEIADALVSTALGSRCKVRYLFIAAAPEMMAYVKTSSDVDGFVYVSASHNPIGHNGLKFGADDGGVLGGGEAGELRARFLALLEQGSLNATARRAASCATGAREARPAVYAKIEEEKHRALDSYARFMETVVAGPFDHDAAVRRIDETRRRCERRALGIVGELNGSARSVSIDGEFLRRLGMTVALYNNEPGAVVHRIVPEGESLDPCRRALENTRRERPCFEIGYVPDNDGDRGNLVYIDGTGRAVVLHAQAVFALSCVAELAYLASMDDGREAMERTAVVVNGPTSMRIDRIAERFGARVFRTEVGESQVVGRAAELRAAGLRVRVFGEGSNGGTIIHPSSVRDPLSTIAALLKLLRMPPSANRPSPLDEWRRVCGLRGADETTVAELLASLPTFSTTGAYEKRAVMTIDIHDHGEMKKRYEALLRHEWRTNEETLRRRFGFAAWRVINYEGTRELPGIGNRDPSGSHRGGLKVVFSDSRGRDTAFIWMRGSGTEPVFRVLADIEGDDAEGEAWLLEWQKRMIRSAAK